MSDISPNKEVSAKPKYLPMWETISYRFLDMYMIEEKKKGGIYHQNFKINGNPRFDQGKSLSICNLD